MAMAAPVAAAFYLSAPARAVVGPPPPDLAAESLGIPSRSGADLAAWFVPGRPGAGAVVVMHGVRANRASLIGRMRLLREAGYAVLAFDFQAHGESGGDRITFGHLESMDAEAAVAWMRDRLPRERIAVVGTSLGGAAALLSRQPLPVDALVLESVYPDIGRAVANRLALRLGRLGEMAAPLLVTAGRLVMDLSADDLPPIDRIGTISVPVLIVAGTADTRTTLADSRALFGHAPEPRELWEVAGADHVDLLAYDGQGYREHVLGFLERTLRSPQ
jgi:fermentation-respiration switch protein FrsA (DUF1100 family)